MKFSPLPRAKRVICRAAIAVLEPRFLFCLDHDSLITELAAMGRPEAGSDQTTDPSNPTLGRRGGDGSGQADIVWVNRGNTNDRFAAVFGANAAAARAIVDQVILDFEAVITDFNRISPGSNNTLNLTISMGVTNGLGGLANFITYDAEGKPTAGRMTLQAGNDGAGSGALTGRDARLARTPAPQFRP